MFFNSEPGQNNTNGISSPRKDQITIPLLTVAIPTRNRAEHLRELLSNLLGLVGRDRLWDAVEIIVSDNGSTDLTPIVCEEFKDRIYYVRHPKNVGFDSNVWSCYQEARSPYVLFFSDDDIPDPTLLTTLVNLLGDYQPAVMLYSFLQPPHTAESPTIDIATSIELVTDPAFALRYLLKFAKLTAYCIRKRAWDRDEIDALTDKLGTNYFFITLAIFTFLKERHRGCLLHRRTLARCREDFNRNFRFDPYVFANREQAADIGDFRELAPRDLVLSLKSDPLSTALIHLRSHYLGDLTFDRESLERGERFIREHLRQLWTASRARPTIGYLTAKYIRSRKLQKLVFSMVTLALKLILWIKGKMRIAVLRVWPR